MHFYFVHPQIKLTSIVKAKLSLFGRPNRAKITEKLSVYMPNKQFVFTDMGRSAFKLVIEKKGLQNSEMLIPAYICDIFQPILTHYKIKPIFLDIDLKTFHIKTEDIQNKITPNTKSILVCHTYGLLFDIEALRKQLRGLNHRLIIIEDCAHAFFAKKNGVFAGNLGDVSFFSLYKQFPALRGGMAVCPSDWQVNLPATKFNFRDFISFLNYFAPLSFLFKKFGSDIAPKILRKEKLDEIGGINNASLNLFANFFEDAEKSLENRRKLALILQAELKALGFGVQEGEGNVFCYLSVLAPKEMTQKRDEIVKRLRKYGVFCTRIWHTPIALNQEDLPNTFEAAKRIINIPLQNHYSEKDAKRIINAVKKAITIL
ncbi:MAG: aminotransferase class I/II-fold pyridoxal phosphate-dependent enzyme [Candidatus Nealsonbacteria bacterium]|nr:aminotransferase class I/II-fold pyridoxal phosphate-dependent enzyme [Candidatus Nealsonbacteria bacterium]